MRINYALITRTLTATAVIGSAVLLGLPAKAAAQDANPITGTVRDDQSKGLKGICVRAIKDDPSRSHVDVASTESEADGSYLLEGLPPGDIYVSFQDCNSPATYVGEWYGDTYNSDRAVPVPRGSDGSAAKIDVVLSPGVTVSGNVTDPSGDGVEDVDVSVNSDERDGAHGWGETDADGNYMTSPVLPGDYRVRFQSNDDTYAIQYWSGESTWDSANKLTVSDPRTDINAQLMVGARITGTVTRPGGTVTRPGDRAPDICVSAAYRSGDDWDNVGGAETNASGEYELSQLPAGSHRVRFEDCDNTGPYLDQWYDGSESFDDATTIKLAAGEIRPDVNVQLKPAAVISGTVTDNAGSRLENVCVQATTDSFTGDMERTDEDGTYALMLARAGNYKLQFIDCGPDDDDEDNEDDGKADKARSVGYYQAMWWDGGSEPETASYIAVVPGQPVSDKDAELSPASGTGTVSGRVTNVRGQGLSACVAVYAPTEAVFFALTEDDGKYSLGGIPTGTWTIGFVGCPDGPDDDGPVEYIKDSGDTGVAFPAQWYGGAPVALGSNSDSPDPIAQGARLVTIHPDDAVNATVCLGCESVEVAPPEIGDDHIVVPFESTGLLDENRDTPNTDASTAANRLAARATLDYRVACSSDRGRATSATVPGNSPPRAFPVKVSGFTPGAPYVCSAQVLSNGFEVTNSATFEVTVGKVTPPAPTPDPEPGPNPDPSPTPNGGAAGNTPIQPSRSNATGSSAPAGSPAKLAYTGGNLVALVGIGLFMILMGLGVALTSMRLSSVQERRRATS